VSQANHDFVNELQPDPIPRKITNTRTPGENARRNFGRWFFGILMLPALGLSSGG
jgi:hypothetical protein